MQSDPRGECRPGAVVGGKYVVERVIGFGGMGTVVAATDTLLNRRVAIKFLLPEASDRPAAMSRFLREARATAGLQSEHVVRVIDAGTGDAGTPYIVMEYLEGRDLGEYLHAAHPIPVTEAVDLLLQAGEAVAEAHAIGIVHRDLKPSNLFVTTDLDGRRKLKVLDFGISMFVGASLLGDGGALTGTGDLIGSPLYMSPEQLRDARRVSARTDIWAFGVILYELLTGISPFRAETMTAICARIVSEAPPPIRETRPDIPRKLEGVILACLEKDESKRIPTMAELARRLAPFAGDERAARRIEAIAARERHVAVSPSGRPQLDPIDTSGPTVADLGSAGGRRSRRRWQIRVAGTALLALAGAGWASNEVLAWRTRVDVAALDAAAPVAALASASAAPADSAFSEIADAPRSPLVAVPSVDARAHGSGRARAKPAETSSASAHATAIPAASASPAVASDASTAQPAHPTLDQAMDSRK